MNRLTFVGKTERHLCTTEATLVAANAASTSTDLVYFCGVFPRVIAKVRESRSVLAEYFLSEASCMLFFRRS